MKIVLTPKQTVRLHLAYNNKINAVADLENLIQMVLDAHSVDQSKIDLSTLTLNDNILILPDINIPDNNDTTRGIEQ